MALTKQMKIALDILKSEPIVVTHVGSKPVDITKGVKLVTLKALEEKKLVWRRMTSLSKDEYRLT
jgi:hypothetical protein